MKLKVNQIVFFGISDGSVQPTLIMEKVDAKNKDLIEQIKELTGKYVKAEE